MQLNVAMFTTLVIIMTPYMIWTKTIIPKSKTGFLIGTAIGFIKCVNYAFANLAVLYVPVGSATTEMNAVFMLGVLAWTVMCGRNSVSRSSLIIDASAIFLIIAGVVMVIQPPALFPNTKIPERNLTVLCSKNIGDYTPKYNLSIDTIPSDASDMVFEDDEPIETLEDREDRPAWKGHLYMVLFGITSTATVVLLSKSSAYMSTAETIYWSAVAADVISIALFLPNCKNTAYIPEGTLCLCIWLIHALCGSVSGLFGNTAVILLPTTDFAVVSALSLANLFVLQFTVLRSIKPAHVNLVSVLGAILICIICFGKPVLRKVYQNSNESKDKEKNESKMETKALLKQSNAESSVEACMFCYF